MYPSSKRLRPGSEGLRLVFIGEALGLGAALALHRVLSSLVFGILTTDITTYVVVALGLAIVAAGALRSSPARRWCRPACGSEVGMTDPLCALV